MLKRLLVLTVVGVSTGLGACDKKPAPAAPASPAGGTGGVSGTVDSAKKAASSAADAITKEKNDLLASSSKKLEDLEKGSADWKTKIEALPAATKDATSKLYDDFQTTLKSAKDSVTKLKDSTSANFSDLSTKANDALKKASDAFANVKSKLGG